LKKNLRKKKSSNSKPRQKTNHTLQKVAGDYQLGTISGKEHKYSTFYQSSKRYERKVRCHTSKQTVHYCLC